MARASPDENLELGIVASAPAASRVADAACTLARVLLRDDPRVQAVYRVWAADAAKPAWTEPDLLGSLQRDFSTLAQLVRDLGLETYRWLPKYLFWEFFRVSQGAPEIVVTFPPNLTWASAGKRPKRGGPKGFRLEDLDRTISRFYRCEVKTPRDSKKRLAKEQGCDRKDIRAACQRARTLLNCIDRPFPTSDN